MKEPLREALPLEASRKYLIFDRDQKFGFEVIAAMKATRIIPKRTSLAETKTWDKTMVDRKAELNNWVEILRAMAHSKKIRKIFAFSNNHYAGYGLATVKLFMDLWDKK